MYSCYIPCQAQHPCQIFSVLTVIMSNVRLLCISLFLLLFIECYFYFSPTYLSEMFFFWFIFLALFCAQTCPLLLRVFTKVCLFKTNIFVYYFVICLWRTDPFVSSYEWSSYKWKSLATSFICHWINLIIIERPTLLLKFTQLPLEETRTIGIM